MSRNEDKKQDAIMFFIEDFKDTSEKLESTDKKCQFIIQMYGAFATILISIMAAFYEKINADLLFRDGLFCGIIFFLIFIGEFIYIYVVKGGVIHLIYLNRMNSIRKLILNSLELKQELRENYSFIKIHTKRSKGMGYTMEGLLRWLILLLSLPAIVEILYKHLSPIRIIFCIIIIVISIALMIYNYFYYLKSYNKTLRELNKIFPDEICESDNEV